MNETAGKNLHYETRFLSSVSSQFDEAKGTLLRGKTWFQTEHDESDRLRALLAKNRIFDREALKSMPSNKRAVLHGFEPRLLFWKKRTGVAIASTLSPMEHFAAGKDENPPKVTLHELHEHVKKIMVDQKIPHVIGVCAPGGFTEEAITGGSPSSNISLILVEPDGAGGFKVHPTDLNADPRLIALFDPEKDSDKINRIFDTIDEMAADIDMGGVTEEDIAEKTKLPINLIQHALEEYAARDPEIRVTESEGVKILYRGAMSFDKEKKSMNVIDRIKKLFSGEGDENEKVNMLTERRAGLMQRRSRLYEQISNLEKREQQLIEEGKAATSAVPKRRLASQVAQLRKDIARANTVTSMLNNQIDILSTDIHNLTLIKQGEMAELPDTETLTENAVKAEEMLESLKNDSELINTLETGIIESSMSDEELAILKEFDQPEQVADTTSEEASSSEQIDLPGESVKGNEKSKGKPDPEIG